MSGYKVGQGLNQVSKSRKALKNKVKRSKVQKQSLKPRYKGPGTKSANFETCLASYTGQAARIRIPGNLRRAASDCQHQNSWTAAISGLLTDFKCLFSYTRASPMVFHA
ncbi:hypothetical protein HanPSC8_Chr16g0723691 [Helianthus annuus]|nr:hypothetical protein HanPSC8_Chr16g0723691 [Helianthus annuus]